MCAQSQQSSAQVLRALDALYGYAESVMTVLDAIVFDTMFDTIVFDTVGC
jgi:hypothetical protein